MKSKQRNRSFFMVLVIVFSFLFSAIPFAKTEIPVKASGKGEISLMFEGDAPAGYKALPAEKRPPTIELWHYSGGSWGNGVININDSELKGDIPKYLEERFQAKSGGANGYNITNPPVPAKVREALNEGKKVIAQLNSYGDMQLEDLLHNVDDVSKHSFTDKGKTFEFKTFPRFNYQQREDGSPITMQDFNFNTKIQLPFVMDGYGSNGWAIYRANGTFNGDWASYSNWKEWNTAGGNKISHHKMKPDGGLHPGYMIDTGTVRGVHPSESIRVGGLGNFNSGGSTALHFLYPFQWTYYIEDDIKEDVILTEMNLIDENGKVVEWFKRGLDPTDPLNESKQKRTTSSSNPKIASTLKRDVKYTVKAKYQFISFIEGNFDITKPATMNPVQVMLSALFDDNKLESGEAYDENALVSGVFDKTNLENSVFNPFKRMLNMEEREFEWEFEVPKEVKQYVKISGVIPEGHFSEEKNQNPNNDWGVVYGKVEQNDMGLTNLKLYDEDGKEVQQVEPNKKYTADVVVNHVEGNDIIGDNNSHNPKAKVIYNVIDKDNNNILPDSPKQTTALLNPKGKITMPKSNTIEVKKETIRVCATIDPKHEELGYNSDPSNDKICKEFKINKERDDMGLTNLILYDSSGRPVEYLEANKGYTVDVVVNHVEGNRVIGDDTTKNPKPTIKYKVMEIGSGVVLHDNTVQTNQLLQPKGSVKMPKSNSFSSSKGYVKVCATIDNKHAELGYNYKKTNDTVCKEFGMIKNYSVLNFEASPSGINLGKNENSLPNHPIGLSFTIGNETHKDAPEKLPSSIRVEIRNRGSIVWAQNVSVMPGSTTSLVASVQATLYPGDNNFTIEVNPAKNPTEFKPGVSNPYLDNVRSLSIKATRFQECQECMVNGINTRNDWRERWSWTEQRGTVKSSTFDYCLVRNNKWIPGYPYTDWWGDPQWAPGYLDTSCKTWDYNVPYEYCDVYYYKAWSEVHDHWEEYKISEVRFGSKYHQDTQGGNRYKKVSDGGDGTIKAGYGFELEIDTTYRTNRNIAPNPEPDWGNWYSGDKYGVHGSGYCDIITRVPGIVPVNAPRWVYVEMPYHARGGGNVCYILNEYSDQGGWANLKRTFRLPNRQSPTGEMQRRIYINKDAKPNNKNGRKSYPIKIVTPRPDKYDRFYGYEPGSYQVGNGKKSTGVIPGSYLHDCHTIYVIIKPNEDVHSHIIQ